MAGGRPLGSEPRLLCLRLVSASAVFARPAALTGPCWAILLWRSELENT